MITTSRGHFWIHFDNGYTVSVFNDFGSYSENHFNYKLGKSFMDNKNQEIKSTDCEVGIIYQGTLCNPFGWPDSVKGYVKPKELIEIIEKVSKL